MHTFSNVNEPQHESQHLTKSHPFGFAILYGVFINEISMNYSDILENGLMIVRCEEQIATDYSVSDKQRIKLVTQTAMTS